MKFSLISINGRLCFPGKCNLLSSLRKRRNSRRMALDGCKGQIKEESINVLVKTRMREIPPTPGCLYLGLQGKEHAVGYTAAEKLKVCKGVLWSSLAKSVYY